MLKNKLKEIRMREYMMNSSQFAEMLGEKLTTYSSWENEKSCPSLEKAFDIAKRLNKKLEEIWYE